MRFSIDADHAGSRSLGLTEFLFSLAVARSLSFTPVGKLLDHVCPPVYSSQHPRIVSIVVYICAYLIPIFSTAPMVRLVIRILPSSLHASLYHSFLEAFGTGASMVLW